MSSKTAKRNKARRNKAKRDKAELKAEEEADELSAAFSTLAAGPSSSSQPILPPPEPRLFKIRDIPGKGRGLVATVDIPEGTRIIKEEPLVVVPLGPPFYVDACVSETLKTHGATKKRAFLNLYNFEPEHKLKLYSTVNTNALPHKGDTSAVYEIISRLNHGCRPNSQVCWNENIQMQTVHAIRPISSGEEITFNYGTTAPREERRVWLKNICKIDRACEACTLSTDEALLSDFSRGELRALSRAVNLPDRMQTDITAVRQDTLDLLHYIECEFGPNYIMRAETFEIAYKVAVLEGWGIIAERHAQSAYDIRAIAQGADHPDAKRILLTMCDPVGDPLYGTCATRPENLRDT